MSIQKGDCAKIPDGRIARVRSIEKDGYKVRVRRKTSKTHQFLTFKKNELTQVACPKGWMSPDGYNRYLKVTLDKMKIRNKNGKIKSMKKKQHKLTVKELEHDFPNLLPPTENVEENLSRGTAGLVPDPDDIPGGVNLNGTTRPDIEEAEAEAEQESEEGEIKETNGR